MNDYKELIDNVRICSSGDCCGCTLHGNKINCQEVLLESVADAIEQLVKERNAAVNDLERYGRWCVTCKHRDKSDFSPNCTPIKCSTDENEFWEWRGVKEDNDDKID